MNVKLGIEAAQVLVPMLLKAIEAIKADPDDKEENLGELQNLHASVAKVASKKGIFGAVKSLFGV